MMRKLLAFSLLLNLGFAAAGFWAVQRLGGFSYVQFKMQHHGISGVYAHRVDQYVQSPTPEGAVVFLGNSLTAQGAWGEWYPQWPIYNRGIEGDQCHWMLERLEPIQQQHAAVIVLMIGINDLIAASPETVLERYGQLVTALRQGSPNTAILVQSLLPVNNSLRQSGIDNAAVRKLNQALVALSRESACTYVDLHRHFCDAEGRLNTRFSVDGIHLNGAGYALWRSVLEPFLEQAVKNSGLLQENTNGRPSNSSSSSSSGNPGQAGQGGLL